jgi:hypothetical protein
MKQTIAAFLLSAAAVLAETNGAWTGTITDSMCFQNHAMMNSKNDANCVKECVKSNPKAYKYVLFDGKNSYKLSDQQAPEQYAGQKVVVKGTLFGKTGVIKVDSIAAAK